MSPSLARRALSGFGWGAVSTVVNVGFQLLLTAAMARLLAPEAFGLMAMATVALRVLSYVSQVGIGPALVQREQLSDADLRLAWTLSLGISGAVCLLALLLAPLGAAYFRRPDLLPVLRAMSFSLLLGGLGTVATALLRRELRFRALAVVETLSYVLGYGATGLALAWSGFGVWALVGASLAQAAVAALLALWLRRHDWRLSLAGDRRALLGYGSRHSAISFIEFLGANVDAMIIGRLLGEAALGLYSRALLLTNLPTEKMAGVLGRVLFPLLSASQRDERKVGEALQLGLLLIGLAGGGTSLWIAASAEPVVVALLGPRWADAVPIVAVLALSVPAMFMSNVAGIVCDAIAFLTPKLALQSLATGALVIGLWAAHSHGLRAMAWVIVAVEWVRLAAYLLLLRRRLHIAARPLVALVGATVLCSGGVYGAVSLCLAMAEFLGPGLRLLVAIASGFAGGLIGLWLGRGLLRSSPGLALLGRQLPAARPWLARFGLMEAA